MGVRRLRPRPVRGGYVELTKDPVDWAYHLILPPVLAVTLFGAFFIVLLNAIMDRVRVPRPADQAPVMVSRSLNSWRARGRGVTLALPIDPPADRAGGAAQAAPPASPA